MKMNRLLVCILGLCIAGVASAETLFNAPGGSIQISGNWTNGLPASSNPGTIALDGLYTGNSFGFSGAVVTQTAGTLTGNAFNFTAGTWNLQGGTISSRFFLSNGSGTIINLSGGTVLTGEITGTAQFGTANGGAMSISGDATIDANGGSVLAGGEIDFLTGWTGSWIQSNYSGTQWRTTLTGNANFKLDGTPINAATFDATFLVTNGGKTLEMTQDDSLVARIPAPADGASNVAVTTDLDWLAPMSYPPTGYEVYFGTNSDVYANVKSSVATIHYDLSGELDFSTTYYWVVDSLDSATNYPGTPWSFTTESGIFTDTIFNVSGGNFMWSTSWDNGLPTSSNLGSIALDGVWASATIGLGAGTVINQTAGTLTGSSFNFTSGTWNLQGGTIDCASYLLSNGAGTIMNLSGGTIKTASSQLGTANGGIINISGGATIQADSGTVPAAGDINFLTGWTGSWSQGNYSGSQWKTTLTGDPDFKFDGTPIDAATFDAIFLITNGGQTLEMIEIDYSLARDPSPSDGWENISVSTDLDWLAPTNYLATGYEVYFGTNSDVYANAKSSVATNHYDLPGELDFLTTYYWVVDAKDGEINHPGTVWSFVTESDPTALYDPFGDLQKHSVVWDSPSTDSAGSMPLGNGDLGMNVWAEPDGDLLLLLSKTDAWSDNGRLLKLGRLRISMDPNPFASDLPFIQTLNLANGEILITAGSSSNEVNLRVWADAHYPAIYIEAEGETLRNWQADVELWRTSQRPFIDAGELNSAYGIRSDPNPPLIEPDTVVSGLTDNVTWYHRNVHSIWSDTLSVQALSHLNGPMIDPLLDRTFGATLYADGFSNSTATRLVSDAPRSDAQFTIVPLTALTSTAADWQAALAAKVADVEATPFVQRYVEHADWWNTFWERHWMVVNKTGSGIVPGSDAYSVTQGYLLQRFMNACAGRGAMPIKFNGSLFTVDATSAYDADYRLWGPCYWFQNTRLPYWSMPMSGDLDLMEPFFKMYMDALPLARERVQTYYGHAGAYFPETMYFWGTWNNDNYGWDRTGRPDGNAVNAYIRWEWQGGIELLSIMLARYNAAPDSDFANDTLVPMAQDIIDLYDLRFPRIDGLLYISPAQGLETYQGEAPNPAPEIAGLNQVLGGLLELPEDLTTPAQRSQWIRLLGELPQLAMHEMNGQIAIAPAETFGSPRNLESPELYPVFPYGLYHVGKPDLALADWTYETRVNAYKYPNGWGQDSIFAAMLGRTEEARGEVVRRSRTKHSGSRFPAMWGPNGDWIPDQDHGGVNMIALQKMVLQEDGDRILLFPAWPADWDLKFRFHARGNTVIEGELRAGQIIEFNITPRERYADVETFIGTLPPQLTGWEDWRRNTPGAGGNVYNDGDGDGFEDLAEYALGGDPTDPATPEGMIVAKSANATNLSLSYTRPIGLSDILYGVEETPSLTPVDWQLLVTPPTIVDNGDGTESVSFEQPVDAWDSFFYRLKMRLKP